MCEFWKDSGTQNASGFLLIVRLEQVQANRRPESLCELMCELLCEGTSREVLTPPKKSKGSLHFSAEDFFVWRKMAENRGKSRAASGKSKQQAERRG
jgi:hypothetical protein